MPINLLLVNPGWLSYLWATSMHIIQLDIQLFEMTRVGIYLMTFFGNFFGNEQSHTRIAAAAVSY